MAKELTADDLASYMVTLASPEGSTRAVRAAYVMTEPGWVVFKDHKHREVGRVNEQLVIMVERLREDSSADSDEDRIRDAMAEAQDHPGRVVTR
jgi:hypothetical protein